MLQNIDVTMIMTVAVAFVWAFMLLQWLTFFRQFLAIKPEVLPADLKLTDREAVLAAAAKLADNSILHVRLRNLLESWSRGASHIDMVEMASIQSNRHAARLRGALFFSVLVMAGAFFIPGLTRAACTGLGVAGATYFLYMLVLGRMDAFIERNLLSKLPGQVEGTQLTADALAERLGEGIQKAFREYMPQPEKVAAAVMAAVDAAMKSNTVLLEKTVKDAGAGLDAAHKKLMDAQEALAAKSLATNREIISGLDASCKVLLDAQEALAAKWSGYQKEAATGLDSSCKVLLDAQDALATKWTGYQKETSTGLDATYKKLLDTQDALAAKWAASQKETQDSLDAAKKALEGVAGQLQAGLANSADKWHGALTTHAHQVTQANQALVAQLEKIQAMGKEIEKLYQVQQAVDGTIKAVTTTQEFKDTLSSLKKHVEESDKLLREVSKPRTVRLIESTPEIA